MLPSWSTISCWNVNTFLLSQMKSISKLNTFFSPHTRLFGQKAEENIWLVRGSTPAWKAKGQSRPTQPGSQKPTKASKPMQAVLFFSELKNSSARQVLQATWPQPPGGIWSPAPISPAASSPSSIPPMPENWSLKKAQGNPNNLQF